MPTSIVERGNPHWHAPAWMPMRAGSARGQPSSTWHPHATGTKAALHPASCKPLSFPVTPSSSSPPRRGRVTPFWGPPPLATPQAAAAATPHGGRSPSPSWPLPFMGKRAAVSWGAAQPPKLLELALELALLRCSTDRAQHTDTRARAGVCSARITSAAPRAKAGPPNCDGENNCTADAFCE